MKHVSFKTLLRRHTASESGASLIEFTVVSVLFLLVFFAVLDFGRLGFNWVMTEKAIQRAARIATVRPPVCSGVPEIHVLQSGATPGALCRTGSACAAAATRTCILSATAIDCSAVSNTAGEIWCIVQPILPSNATPSNIWVQYRYDQRLGFAGGPYTPMVEVGVVTSAEVSGVLAGTAARELRFEFITPIPALAAMAGGGSPANINAPGTSGYSMPSIAFPDLSVSLPGEDLNQGNNG